MNLLKELTTSFMGQGLLGFAFLGLIVICGVYSAISSMKISKEYSKLTDEFNLDKETKGDGEEISISNEVLSSIVNDFKSSAKRGTENINTEVIIQRRLDKNIKALRKEKFVKSVPAICIALGLLGTFLGLTLAIVQTRGVLSQTMGSTSEFGQAMEAPFASMSSAFWTSIFGVASSVILNVFNVNLENKKEAFYDVIEDYLDNTIYSLYAKNFASQFSEFNGIIRSSMLSLTGEMKNLFEDGVKELVGKINKNTIDLTDTVKGLTNYTKDLERLTTSLDASVRNFKEPVDTFKSTMHNFIQTSEDTTKNMMDSVTKFATKVDILDDSLNNVHHVINSNKEVLELIGRNVNSQVSQALDAINTSQSEFMNIVKLVNENQNINNEEFNTQLGKLNEGYIEFSKSLSGFVENLNTTQKSLATDIADTLTTEFSKLSDSIIVQLNTSINQLDETSKGLKTNYKEIGYLVKQTNDLYNNTNKENILENTNSIVEMANV